MISLGPIVTSIRHIEETITKMAASTVQPAELRTLRIQSIKHNQGLLQLQVQLADISATILKEDIKARGRKNK